MQVQRFSNGFQLEFNCTVHIHSLSHNRRRPGVDRDSSLTSGRKKSERRSIRNGQNAAVAENLRIFRPSYSTSRKDQHKRVRDGDEEQGVSPVKSFPLGAGHESAGNSPPAPMVAQSQFPSSGSKRSLSKHRGARCLMPYFPVEAGK